MTPKPAPLPPQLRTVEEACAQLGVERRKLYELMSSGALKSVKLPPGTRQSGRRIEQTELDDFIKRNTVTS